MLERALHRVAGDRGYAMDAHEVVLHGACAGCTSAGDGRDNAPRQLR